MSMLPPHTARVCSIREQAGANVKGDRHDKGVRGSIQNVQHASSWPRVIQSCLRSGGRAESTIVWATELSQEYRLLDAKTSSGQLPATRHLVLARERQRGGSTGTTIWIAIFPKYRCRGRQTRPERSARFSAPSNWRHRHP